MILSILSTLRPSLPLIPLSVFCKTKKTVEGKNSDEISRIEKNITNYYINKILSMSSLLIGRYNYNLPKKHKEKNNNDFFKKNCGNKR